MALMVMILLAAMEARDRALIQNNKAVGPNCPELHIIRAHLRKTYNSNRPKKIPMQTV